MEMDVHNGGTESSVEGSVMTVDPGMVHLGSAPPAPSSVDLDALDKEVRIGAFISWRANFRSELLFSVSVFARNTRCVTRNVFRWNKNIEAPFFISPYIYNR